MQHLLEPTVFFSNYVLKHKKRKGLVKFLKSTVFLWRVSFSCLLPQLVFYFFSFFSRLMCICTYLTRRKFSLNEALGEAVWTWPSHQLSRRACYELLLLCEMIFLPSFLYSPSCRTVLHARGRGGSPIYKLYRYVPLVKGWVFEQFSLE